MSEVTGNIMLSQRFIIHVDMDAFFASVEQRDRPQYKGKPVVVGADPKQGKGRGVVSTCSYEARKFGIHSAMPISIAFKKCPQAIFLAPDMEKYSRESKKILEIFYSFTPQIEPVGIDEAFLDVTNSFHLFGTAQKLCARLKEKIKNETDLTASVGCAPTKMAAKIASDLKKPDGLVIVSEGKLLDFLWPLPIGKIWGLGKKSEEALRNIGIKTIGQLAKQDAKFLISIFGKGGEGFHNLANGIDDREVEAEDEVKSVSNEITFEKDTLESQKIEAALMGLSDEVASRLRKDNLKGRTITLKIRITGFLTYSRANTLDKPTDLTGVIFKEIKKLYQAFDTKGKKIRLVGVKVSNFAQNQNQLLLFGREDEEKKEKIEKAVDKIRKQFGNKAICRALAQDVQ